MTVEENLIYDFEETFVLMESGEIAWRCSRLVLTHQTEALEE